MNFRPVVIIGAPRSGTNMLRDALTRLDGWATWPCDEINYIWRHGNVRHPSDEYTPEMARPEVRRYIRGHFERLARRHDARYVVEKTCANSLRVGFVERVAPEAHFIFIRRDGYDVIGSAIKRWHAPLDLKYLYDKARFVPILDLPYYATRYLWNRLYRVFSRDGRLAYWGPQLDEVPITASVAELSALQWRRCVESAYTALGAMPRERWTEVAYESLVHDPATELMRIVRAIGFDASDAAIAAASAGISRASVGKGRDQLGPDAIASLEPIVGATQRRFGYA